MLLLMSVLLLSSATELMIYIHRCLRYFCPLGLRQTTICLMFIFLRSSGLETDDDVLDVLVT
jgi:hypothetical protein